MIRLLACGLPFAFLILPFALLRIPGAPIVQLVISCAQGQFSLVSGPALVATAKMSGTLIMAILIGTAPGRLMVCVCGQARKQVANLVQTFLKFFFVDLLHSGPATRISLRPQANSWPAPRTPEHLCRNHQPPYHRQTPGSPGLHPP